MGNNRTMNNQISCLRKKYLRLIYISKQLYFEALLGKDRMVPSLFIIKTLVRKLERFTGRGSFLVKFPGKIKTVIPSAASSAIIGYARVVAVLEAGRSKMASLNVGLVQVRKQRRKRIVNSAVGSVLARICKGWSKVWDLLPLLISSYFPL